MAYGNYAPFYRPGYFNPMQTPTMPNVAENQITQPFQQPQMQVAPTQNTNDMIFVLNENEASSFPVLPNNRVVLWDKNQKTFYVKSANAQGIPSMQIYDFTERPQNTPQTPTEHTCQCGDKFATKEQLNVLQDKFDDIMAIVEDLQTKSSTKITKSTKKTEAE